VEAQRRDAAGQLARQLDDEAEMAALMAAESLGNLGEVAVAPTITQLQNGSAQARRLACIVLADVGPASEPALDILMEVARTVPPDEAKEAVLAIGAIGEAARPAIPLLVQMADEPELSDVAIEALGRIGSPAVDELREMLVESGEQRAFRVADALSMAGGDADDAMADLLDHDDSLVRSLAASVMVSGGIDGDENLAALREAMSDDAVRDAVVHHLDQMGQDGATLLTGLMDHERPAVRLDAIEAVGELGVRAEPAVDELVAAMGHEHGPTREAAARALGGAGVLTGEVVDVLVAHLDDVYLPAAAAAAEALMDIEGAADELEVDTLEEALGSPAARVRIAAAVMLGRKGDEAVDALPELVQTAFAAAGRTFELVPVWIAVARLGESTEKLLPEMIDLVDEAQRRVAESPAGPASLGEGGEKVAVIEMSDAAGLPGVLELRDVGPEALPLLVEVVRKDDDAMRHDALRLIARLENEAQPAVPVLIDLLGHDERDTRQLAVRALGRIGPAAEPAVGVLVDMLDETSRDLALDVIVALGSIGVAAAEAWPTMLELFEKTDAEDIRMTILDSLLLMGPPPEDLVPKVAELLDHESIEVRMSAARIIADLDEEALRLFGMLLERGDEQSREVALVGYTAMGPRADKAADRLVDHVRQLEGIRLFFAVDALMAVSPPDPALIEGYIGTMDEESREDERLMALMKVVHLLRSKSEQGDEQGRIPEEELSAFLPAVPVMARLLTEDDADLRTFAALGLGFMRGHAGEAVDELIANLAFADPDVRAMAAASLGEILGG
jgi:HEAT repeat protein